MTPVLRDGRPADLTTLWAIRTEAIRYGCGGVYARSAVEAWASVPMPPDFGERLHDARLVVAEIDDTARGYGFLDARRAELLGLFVSPTAQRRGLGHGLVGELERRAIAHGVTRLGVNATLNAEAFYAGLGYSAVERDTWHHPNGFELARVRMVKRLS